MAYVYRRPHIRRRPTRAHGTLTASGAAPAAASLAWLKRRLPQVRATIYRRRLVRPYLRPLRTLTARRSLKWLKRRQPQLREVVRRRRLVHPYLRPLRVLTARRTLPYKARRRPSLAVYMRPRTHIPRKRTAVGVIMSTSGELRRILPWVA